MEEQIEESDVLGSEAWNDDYDIADEEEERLLEEHELVIGTEDDHGNEHSVSLVDGEEDVLDLGLNEDIIEYEDSNNEVTDSESNGETPGKAEEVSKNTSSVQQNAVPKDEVKQTQQRNSVPQFTPRKPFVNHQQQQIRPGNVRPMNFMSNRPMMRRPPFPERHLHPRSLMGAKPGMMDFGPGPGMYMRPPGPMQREPFYMSAGQPLIQNRHPQYQQFPVNGNQFDQDRGNGGGSNRCFINPHYKGSVNIQGQKPPADLGPCFAQPNKGPPPVGPQGGLPFRGRPQRPGMPPPGSGGVGPLRPPPRNMPGMPNVNFPPPLNVPPPRLNVASAGAGAPPSVPARPPLDQKPRFPGNPQPLMDVIVPPPFRETPAPRGAYFTDQRRFRPNFQEPPPSQPPPPFMGPPPPSHHFASAPVKRLSGEMNSGVPFKRPSLEPPSPVHPGDHFRNLSLGSFQPRPGSTSGSGTVNSTAVAALPFTQRFAAPSTVRTCRVSNLTTVRLAPSSSLSTVSAATTLTVTTASATACTTGSAISSTDSSKPVSTPAVSEEVSEEMKEYLKKVEEQREKRDQVLRMKEERRRNKLAVPIQAQLPASHTSPLPGNVVNVSVSTADISSTNAAAAVATAGQESQICNGKTAVGELEPAKGKLPFRPATTTAQPATTIRKTLLVKPTPAVPSNAPAATSETAPVAEKKRYKVIIVKNKNGEILEKRRVPIDDEAGSSGALASAERSLLVRPVAPRSVPSLTSRVAPARVSETVEIENLNPNSTEEDVKNLCRIFGPVQEIYPKLQEGKAIVRFTTVSGANNFVHNHNTPGICVQFL